MIGEKIKNPKKSSGKAKRIGGLLDYLRAPSRARAQEKCLHYGAQGFLTDTPAAHRLEMIALATDAARSTDPVNHYVLSWRQGQQPTGGQVDEAAAIVLEHMGLQDHQAVWALHGDTDNFHVHLVVSRVHPLTERPVKVEFDIERLHEAVALIEHRQGWQPEDRARYRVDARGELERQRHDGREQPERTARVMERQTGQQSAQRVAMELAAPIIAAAGSWEQLHRELAAEGLRYERTGSGAVLWVGQTAVKASKVARAAGFGRLQQRLGPYQPAPQGLEVQQGMQPAAPRSMRPDHPQWPAYQQARNEAQQARRKVMQTLGAIARRQRGELAEHQRQRRQRILGGSWRGKGQLLNAVRQVLGEEQRAERRALQLRHAEARAKLRRHYAPQPSFRTWLGSHGQHAAAEQTRLATVSVPGLAPRQQGTGVEGLHARYLADAAAAARPAERALQRAAAAHAARVAELQRVTRRRWGAAKLMMRGRATAAIWAQATKRAVSRDWERLHQRRRRELQQLSRAHPSLDFTAWLQAEARRGDLEALTALRSRDRDDRRGNAVLGTGRFADGALKVERGAATVTKFGAVVYDVAGGHLVDEGDRLRLSSEDLDAHRRLLEVARGRFGRRVGVEGDAAFVERLAVAAADSGLDIEFADPAMERRRRELTEETHATDRRRAGGAAEQPGRRPGERAQAGRGRGAPQPNAAVTGADPTAGPRARLRALSEVALARLEDLPQVLLHRDARRHLEQQRASGSDRELRRSPERMNERPRGRGR